MRYATTHTTNTLHAFLAYRFHFYGKEADNEVYGEGNAHDFGARVYDPRLGRWMSVDPMDSKYPSLSPFNFVANCPLILIDPDGEKIIIGKQDQSKFLEDMAVIFGEELASTMFSFNDNDELVINSVVLTDKDKQTVLEGLQTIVVENDITRIVYVNQPGKAYHPETKKYEGDVLFEEEGKGRAGEFTVTIGDNPGRKENTIYIYNGQVYGGIVSFPELYINPVTNKSDIRTKVASVEPRANNLIHALGHVLYQSNKEQGKVIDFDNAGRRATNSTGKAPAVKERPYDKDHPAPSKE